MNKTVFKVFALVALLVGIFLAWQLIFNKGGILKTMYNNAANGVNKQWEKVAGSGEEILPEWVDDNASDNGQAFDIDTSAN